MLHQLPHVGPAHATPACTPRAAPWRTCPYPAYQARTPCMHPCLAYTRVQLLHLKPSHATIPRRALHRKTARALLLRLPPNLTSVQRTLPRCTSRQPLRLTTTCAHVRILTCWTPSGPRPTILPRCLSVPCCYPPNLHENQTTCYNIWPLHTVAYPQLRNCPWPTCQAHIQHSTSVCCTCTLPLLHKPPQARPPSMQRLAEHQVELRAMPPCAAVRKLPK